MEMQSAEARKEATRKFKEIKPLLGIFCVRCTVTAEAWVGSSRNLNATRNGLWFRLRMGSGPDNALQSEWNGHTEAAFCFEILEELAEDVHPFAIGDQLKQKKAEWIQRLGAGSLL